MSDSDVDREDESGRTDEPEFVPVKSYRFYEWINRHPWSIAAVLVVLAVVFAALYPVIADQSEPSFDPKGPIYDTRDHVDEVFASSTSIREVLFIVENPDGGDVLTRDALLALKRNQDAVLADPEAQKHLATAFARDLGVTIEGVYSVANAVDDALPGGLEAASEADVKVVLASLFADDAPTGSLRFLLAPLGTTRDVSTIDGDSVVVWESPAFFARVVYDFDTFDQGQLLEAFGEETSLETERWLRTVQVTLRGDQTSVTAIGVAMDTGLVAEDQTTAAAPYLLAAVAFIVILVGALLRSYWASMVVGAGLGVTMMLYGGINALLGLKMNSPLLIMIVPIALISFGVDFFIHASGRTREMQVLGFGRDRAYPLGLTAVSAALLLAALSSAAAFLSNAVSGIEGIVEFGIAAAVGLLLSYMILGWIAPKLLLSTEERLGPRPADLSHLRTAAQKVGFVVASFIAAIAVTMTIVMPAIGWVLYLIFLALFFYIPYWFTRRRNQRAAETGRPLTDEVKGAGHGFSAAGTTVHFVARWRVFAIPLVAALAVVALVGASRVERGFEVKDFFSSRTDFVVSLDKLEQYWGSGGGTSDYIFIEGDLTDPATLLAIDMAQAEVAASDAEFVRDFNGEVEFAPNAVTVVRIAAASAPMREAIAAEEGVEITDTDGDGIADTPEQIAAIYRYVKTNSVVDGNGIEVFPVSQTETILYVGDGVQGTRVATGIATFTDDEIILAGRAVLEDAAGGLEANLAAGTATVAVSGGAITGQDSMDSFLQSMLLSLPIAVLLTSLLVFIVLFFIFRHFGRRMASILKRSGRYAVISMIPILLVVALVYGFMYLVGYRLNLITAMIAAISIGVGVDYATHFTVRFIEEFEHEPSRFPALRRTGEGTGGALAISAVTSMTGFLIMAAAPMPMFVTFGVLTAVMIGCSLVVTLLVLPSLLLLVTPSRKGDEREDMIDEVTRGGEFDYEPHERATAMRQSPLPADGPEEGTGSDGEEA
jgi:predicted RND superfamily exporter protein